MHKQQGFTPTPEPEQALLEKTPKASSSGVVWGFTLIELLVVIGIIGILASTALFRYPHTLEKMRDSRVISAISQFRMQAAVLEASADDYNDIKGCTVNPGAGCDCVDSTLDILCDDIQANSVQDLIVLVNDDDSGFCAVAFLTEHSNYICCDGTLRVKRYAASPAEDGGACASACITDNSCFCE